MKIGIYCSGENVEILEKNIDFIGVDRGVEILISKGIKPLEVVGDFDSINDLSVLKDLVVHSLSCEKDETDTYKAVERAITLGYQEIDLYGVTGGRLDHFIAVMRLLVKFRTVKITIYNKNNKIYLLERGTHIIRKNKYKYISFFSVKGLNIKITGVKYPLEEYYLDYADGLCISNEIIDEKCELIVSDDVYVVQSND